MKLRWLDKLVMISTKEIKEMIKVRKILKMSWRSLMISTICSENLGKELDSIRN